MEAKSDDGLTDDQFVSLVQRYDTDVRTSTLNIARLCAQKLQFEHRTHTLKRIGLSTAKFSKLVQIGRDTRFDEPSIQSFLPSGFSVLYALSLLSDEQWKKALDQKLVSPTVTRNAINSLRQGATPKKSRSLPLWLLMGLSAPVGFTDEDESRLHKKILAICEESGVQLVRRDKPLPTRRSRVGHINSPATRDGSTAQARVHRRKSRKAPQEEVMG